MSSNHDSISAQRISSRLSRVFGAYMGLWAACAGSGCEARISPEELGKPVFDAADLPGANDPPPIGNAEPQP